MSGCFGLLETKWSSPMDSMVTVPSLSHATCSPYPALGFMNCRIRTFSPLPDALRASPKAAVVFPLPFPVYIWTNPSCWRISSNSDIVSSINEPASADKTVSLEKLT